LKAALAQCVPGDTVVVREGRLSEGPLRVGGSRHKDLTIESGLPAGESPVIEFDPPPSAGAFMLDVHQADGVRVRGIEFDGKGQAEVAVVVSGVAPGTVFGAITVRNVGQAAVRLNAATGEPTRPVTFEGCRFVPGKGANGVEVVGHQRLGV